MKWLARSFVFALTLLLGIAGASIPSAVAFRSDLPELQINEVRHPEERPSVSPKGIHVTYIGFEYDGNGENPYLRFKIYNWSNRSIKYTAHLPEGPFPALISNGKALSPLLRCGTGAQDFYVLPYSWAEVRVPPPEFLQRPNKNDLISVGFYLSPLLEDRYEPHYSAPFLLPEEFRRSIVIR